MQLEPGYAKGAGPTPKFVKNWRLFVYLTDNFLLMHIKSTVYFHMKIDISIGLFHIAFCRRVCLLSHGGTDTDS